MQDHDIVGNKEADKLADRAAEIAELPDLIVQPVIDAQKMAKHIQLRIATVICNLPKRKKNPNNGMILRPLRRIPLLRQRPIPSTT